MADMVLHLTEEETIVLPAQTVRRLVETKSGDACLLYLFMKQNKEAMDEDSLCEKLGWDKDRMNTVKKVLSEAGLISLRAGWAEEKAAQKKDAVPKKVPKPLAAALQRDIPEQPPERKPQYTEEDIARRIGNDRNFAELLREVEHRLGPISTMGVQMLMEMCEYLGLPYDVIYTLVTYCIRRKAAVLGAGRLPTMREIEKEAYVWARKGLVTPEAVEDYLKKLQEQSLRYPEYMKALQMPERKPAPSEEKFLQEWTEMGFPPETIAIAYDKTVFRCHEFKWAYCNGILKRWHDKKLHTPDEVKSEKDAEKEAPVITAEKETPAKNAWMKQYN